jgi:GT2 family glycosyltransferase
MAHVSVVIVHYNSEKETRDCLASLKQIQKDDLSLSVVVVDNGSKEQLVIGEDNMPKKTTILRSDANLGFTSGNNLGISHAVKNDNPDYILLLNNDTTVDPSFLIELVQASQAREKLGVMVPKIYFSPEREFHKESYTPDQIGKVLWYAGGSLDWRNLDAFHRGVDEFDRGHFNHQSESDFATGCCILIPREVLEKVGMFDDKYFLYLEDVDLSIRIQKAGYPIYFCPSAVIWHKNAGSSGGSGSALHQYYQTRNRLYFYWKYGQFRTQFTAAKYAARLLKSGTSIEKRAVLDWVMGRMGKQAIL